MLFKGINVCRVMSSDTNLETYPFFMWVHVDMCGERNWEWLSWIYYFVEKETVLGLKTDTRITEYLWLLRGLHCFYELWFL